MSYVTFFLFWHVQCSKLFLFPLNTLTPSLSTNTHEHMHEHGWRWRLLHPLLTPLSNSSLQVSCDGKCCIVSLTVPSDQIPGWYFCDHLHQRGHRNQSLQLHGVRGWPEMESGGKEKEMGVREGRRDGKREGGKQRGMGREGGGRESG